MKLPVLLSAVVAACLAEEAKVLPLAYAGYPYAGLGYAGAYGYAGLHAAYPYALPAPAKVEVKTVEAPALPALTYAAAPALPMLLLPQSLLLLPTLLEASSTPRMSLAT